MSLLESIKKFKPLNQQEACDKERMIAYMAKNENCLSRENDTAHFTASMWTVNRERTKTLMVYHNTYNSWSWIGGHADGEEDLRSVAMGELKEETGVKNAVLLSPEIFSLEILTVDGHVRKGIYVPSHLHMNVTYFAQAEENQELIVNSAENQGVKWWPLEDALKVSTEPWMVEWVYKKLVERSRL